MSRELTSRAWKVRGLKPVKKLALLYMADVARDPEHEFFENHEKTAVALEVSERHLSGVKKALVSGGHISKKHSKRRVTKDGVRDCFHVHPKLADANPTSVTPEKCDTDRGNLQHRQAQSTTPTEEKSDTPILTSINRTEPRINDATSTGSGGLNGHRLSASLENLLMGRLRDVLGKDEMGRCGGMWREEWVRKNPAIVESALNEIESVIKEGRIQIGNRGAYLMDLVKRWSQPQ